MRTSSSPIAASVPMATSSRPVQPETASSRSAGSSRDIGGEQRRRHELDRRFERVAGTRIGPELGRERVRRGPLAGGDEGARIRVLGEERIGLGMAEVLDEEPVGRLLDHAAGERLRRHDERRGRGRLAADERGLPEREDVLGDLEPDPVRAPVAMVELDHPDDDALEPLARALEPDHVAGLEPGARSRLTVISPESSGAESARRSRSATRTASRSKRMPG